MNYKLELFVIDGLGYYTPIQYVKVSPAIWHAPLYNAITFDKCNFKILNSSIAPVKQMCQNTRRGSTVGSRPFLMQLNRRKIYPSSKIAVTFESMMQLKMFADSVPPPVIRQPLTLHLQIMWSPLY